MPNRTVYVVVSGCPTRRKNCRCSGEHRFGDFESSTAATAWANGYEPLRSIAYTVEEVTR